MALIKRKQELVESLPLLREDIVEVSELGGEVIVRGLMLADRLNITLHRDNPEEVISSILAGCILDGNRQPLFTRDEWERFGARHDDAVMTLWEKALDLSSFKKAAAEKTEEVAAGGEDAKNV